jgi:hypothetical protein
MNRSDATSANVRARQARLALRRRIQFSPYEDGPSAQRRQSSLAPPSDVSEPSLSTDVLRRSSNVQTLNEGEHNLSDRRSVSPFGEMERGPVDADSGVRPSTPVQDWIQGYSPASPVMPEPASRYSPIPLPRRYVLRSPTPPRPRRLETPPAGQARVETSSNIEEVKLTCNICYQSVLEKTGTTTSFVTLMDCNHKMCYGCFTRLLTNYEHNNVENVRLAMYCPFCREQNKGFYVFTSSAKHGFRYTCAKKDSSALTRHWHDLMENNTVNNPDEDDEDSIKRKMEKELCALRAKNSELEHSLIMSKTDVALSQQEQNVLKLDLEYTQQKLDEAKAKCDEVDSLKAAILSLQNQLQRQVAESQEKFLVFQNSSANLFQKLERVMLNSIQCNCIATTTTNVAAGPTQTYNQTGSPVWF